MGGDVVTHRLIGDDEDLDAIARCTSPYLVPVVAAIAPKSLLVRGTFLRLRQLMAESKDMLPDPLIEMDFGHTVASALVDVHAHSLVHGYLSSHNVFFSPALKVHVGVPGTSATDDALLEWTAPEVLAGDAPPSSASDIYAFGILMTEFDTFKLPYEDDAFDDEVALTTAVVDGGYRPALRDNCEEWLQDLVDRCVDADPNLRPTAVELAASLQKLLDQATRLARADDP
ncbi:serine/threonine protein kinase [Saprolegnia parasitica CBS 223.65]|uniref:Serine/threonine protein kinase n=1 Tax=Saprolegnia parasitica (strain CBS 223.65) TaxID=695850 RepID=A0A067C063_SAPPC|nr:serine/threonine protein kinase [Saprolegnia parasitica CBS 223.65]KDO20167.1 serine/threonine protein kinase [Saprolegnia parasitica CBS 223.65]|eukprot:XP_012209116.1 serine/threonine protein kinase [Saprolegnia parasitica CBS 223.65]